MISLCTSPSETNRPGFQVSSLDDRDRPDYAADAFKKEYGFFPPTNWHLCACLGNTPSAEDRAAFREYLARFAPHDFWLSVQMRFEFGDTAPAKKKRGTKSKYQGRKQQSKPFKFSTTAAPWWEVLECSPRASLAEVKAKYRELARKWHPDVCTEAIAETKMKAFLVSNSFNLFQEILKFGETEIPVRKDGMWNFTQMCRTQSNGKAKQPIEFFELKHVQAFLIELSKQTVIFINVGACR